MHQFYSNTPTAPFYPFFFIKINFRPFLPPCSNLSGGVSLMWGELQVIKCRIGVAKKHMGPHMKARSWRCFNATRLLERHKTPPTQRTLIGSCAVTERQHPWEAFNTHRQRYLSVFCLFIWMEWNIYINERPRNTCASPLSRLLSVFQISFWSKKNKTKQLDFFNFQTFFFLYILWDMFWDKNRSQKWGPPSPRLGDKIPTYFTSPPPLKKKKKYRTKSIHPTPPALQPTLQSEDILPFVKMCLSCSPLYIISISVRDSRLFSSLTADWFSSASQHALRTRLRKPFNCTFLCHFSADVVATDKNDARTSNSASSTAFLKKANRWTLSWVFCSHVHPWWTSTM